MIDSGVLADRVGRRADLGQQPCRGRGGQEVALAALEPPGQQAAGGIDVRADVDREREVPLGVRARLVGADRDARVGAEEVDRAEGAFDLRDEVGDLRLDRHIARDAERAIAERFGDRLRAGGVEVGDDHRPGALVGAAQRELAADARRAAGDDHDPV